MINARIRNRLVSLLAAALAVTSMVAPRLPGIRPRDIAGGVIPVGLLSGGLLDGNTLLMSVLLLACSAGLTVLQPQRAKQWGLLFGLAPTTWMVVVMILHGLGDIWPIALVFAMAYGGLITLLGLGMGTLLARLLVRGTSAGAV